MLSVTVRHRFVSVLIDVAFTAASGVTVLFGPSGAGKSSVIGAIAGLLRADRVRVALDGTVLADTEAGVWVPPERRRIGLVFQQPRLFPHMSVGRNLAYGQRRAPAGPIGFEQVVGLLGIGALLTRRTPTLSGGERSRVAIGRALLSQPRLLMMDEPLASLDETRRAEILPYLAQLRTGLGLPIVYVTHALGEAAWLGDTMVLLDQGRVIGAGPLAEMLVRADLPLAQRPDAAAALFGSVASHDAGRGLTGVAVEGQIVWVPLRQEPIGARLRLRVGAGDVIVAGGAPGTLSAHNVLRASVGRLLEDARTRTTLVELSLGAQGMLARITPDAVQALGLQQGGAALAIFKSSSVNVLA